MIQAIIENQAIFWLILGFTLLAIELIAFGLSSGILLFGSLGALLTGMLMWLNVIPENFIVGISSFGVSTAAITALLWIPLRKMQSGAELGNDRSSDLIGHTFTVNNDVTANSQETHNYSGLSWRVEPSIDFNGPTITAGTRVKVTSVKVGVFYVEPISKVNT
ncbi:MAG: NfeD family protein [Granulosicoccus sp.]